MSYINKNNRILNGTLVVNVKSETHGLRPIEGATIEITREDGVGSPQTIRTDISGKAEITLLASFEGSSFLVYNIIVSHPLYNKKEYKDIKVFPNVTTRQPAVLKEKPRFSVESAKILITVFTGIKGQLKPLKDAKVKIKRLRDESIIKQGETDAFGEVVLYFSPLDDIFIEVSHPNYITETTGKIEIYSGKTSKEEVILKKIKAIKS